LALAAPLSRFTSRVGGGSAFFVRPLWSFTPSNFGVLAFPHESGFRGFFAVFLGHRLEASFGVIVHFCVFCFVVYVDRKLSAVA
jgi:hypothetical protein